MKVHYKFLPAVLALLLTMLGASTTVSAQDTGNAPFWTTMAVDATGGFLGASQTVVNGVTFYGDIQNGGAGSMWQNGYLKANVTTSAASGFLYVMWDEPGTTTAFSNMTTIAIAATSTDISIAAPGSQNTGTIWVRFIYSDTALFPGTDTDESGTHTGEIEDYQITIVGTGVQATAVAETGGVTTTIDANGTDVEVTSNGISIFQGPVANAGALRVEGDNTADDSFVVDMSSGDPIPVGGLTIDGNGEASADDLTINDGALNASATYTFTSTTAGSVAVDDGTITYVSVEDPIDDNGLLGNGATGTLFGEFDHDNTPGVEFDVTITDDIEINLGDGNDPITVRQIDATWAPAGNGITINGGNGNDVMTVDFQGPVSVTDPIPGAGTGITFNGEGDTGSPNGDSVVFVGSAPIATVTHTAADENTGTSTFDEPGLLGTIAYNTIEGEDVPIEDELTDADARIFQLTGTGDNITLNDGALPSDDVAFFDSDNQAKFNFDITGTTSVTVTGGAGDDVVNIEQLDDSYTGSVAANPAAGSDQLVLTFNPGEDPIPAAGLTFDGGTTGTNVDTIELNGSVNQTNVIYVDTGAEAGTITNDSGTLTYLNVEGGITDSTPATERHFDFSQGSASTLEFDDETGGSDTTDKMVSSVGQDVVYRSPSSVLDIDAGSGNNLVIINDLDDNFTGSIEVSGQSGDDRLDLDWESNSDSPLAGITTITYDGGSDVAGDDLRLINGTVTYVTHTYSDANSGAVEVDNASDAMTYANIEPIYDFLDATARTFTFPDADVVGVDDIIYLDADDYVSAHSGTLNNFIGTSGSTEGDSNTSEETHFYSDATLTSVTINGGTGDDYFDLEPSVDYAITANGQAPTTFAPGDQITLNVGGLPVDEKITLTESSNTAGTYSFAKQGGGASLYEDLSYTTMELVTLRYSDPNAFSGSTYEGDWTYPVNTESGISIEPYFNWDIEVNQALPGGHPSKYTDLRLDVSLNADLSSPVFQTTTKEDGATLLIASAANEDHYIMDGDRTNPVLALNTVDEPLLMNDTQYYWGLTSRMQGANPPGTGPVFCQISRFTTVNELIPTLDYPSEDLTIYDLDFQFDWNVASPAQDDVYWRMELDNTTAGAFVGDVPGSGQGLLMGEEENDDDTTVADGFADETEFQSTDLPTPLVWGTDYAWRVTTFWPVPPTGWVPQEIFDKDETDRLVNVSDVGEFKTVTKALVPTLTYPDDELTIYTNQPVLSWNVAAPFAALTFEIEIQVKGGGAVCGSPIAGVSGLNYDTANCSPNLVPGTTYEWRVRSSDGNSTSSFSAYSEFTVAGNGVASEAFPSYPVGGLEIYTTSPEFHWFMAKDPTGLTWKAHYLDEAFGVPATCALLKADGDQVTVPAAGTVSVTHVDVSGLQPGATYNWCVTTTGANGDVESAIARFSVAGGTTDGAPTATWPIGNPTTYTLDQELHWSVVGADLGISSYTVEYCVNGPFGSGGPICTTVTGITERQYEITGLDYGDVVLWRVKASYINGAADSAWSDGSFTVTGALNTLSAVLTYPVGGLIIYDDEAQLNWYVNGATLPTGTLTFEVQWSYAESFPTIGSITQTATTTDPFYDVANLIPGHTYWWRVRISLDGGSTYGSWSAPVGSFEVHPGASAVMPRVGSPAQSVVIATSSPTLSWILPTQSTSTLTYDLHIGQMDDLSDAQVFEGIPQTFLRPSDLADGQYYWAVRSHSSDGTTSALSSIGTFVAGSLFSTGVETEDNFGDDTNGDVDVDNGDVSDDVTDDDTTYDGSDDGEDDVTRDVDSDDDNDQNIEDPTDRVLPDEWALGQNYPNPFNPTTTIEFSMPNTAGVTVRVYNVLGQVVKTLVNGTLPAGIHRVQWDATDDTGAGVTSGLYIYRMETEAFQATKTLVLMK